MSFWHGDCPHCDEHITIDEPSASDELYTQKEPCPLCDKAIFYDIEVEVSIINVRKTDD